MLKIFGGAEPIMGDPDAIMVNRGDPSSEKQT
jgi:hypothetical protein